MSSAEPEGRLADAELALRPTEHELLTEFVRAAVVLFLVLARG